MERTFFLLTTICLVILAGCNKATDFSIMAESQGLVCRIENGDNETIAEYTYHSDGKLKESWEHLDVYLTGSDAKYNYTYDNENRLIGKKGFEPGNMLMSSITGAMDKNIERTFTYNENGKLERITTKYTYDEYTANNFMRSANYTYPSEKVVTVSENIVDPAANSIAYYTDFIFNNLGNIVEQQMYYMLSETEKRIYQRSTFEFDSMKTVLNIEPGPKSKNNVTKRTDVVYNFDEQGNQSLAYTSVFQYSYTYNQSGYPETMTETYPNGVKKTNRYFYK